MTATARLTPPSRLRGALMAGTILVAGLLGATVAPETAVAQTYTTPQPYGGI